MTPLPTVKISKGWPKEVAARRGNAIGRVKIYRVTQQKSGYTFFQVADKQNGKRRLLSFGSEADAIKEATRIAKLNAAGESQALNFRDADAVTYSVARARLKPTGIDLLSACGIVADAVKLLGSNRIMEALKFYKLRSPDNLPKRTVAQVIDELLAVKSKRASERHIGDVRARLNKFAETFKTNIASVTTADVQRWLDGLDAAPQTVLNYRTVVNSLFAFATVRNYIPKNSNPVADTERPEVKGGEIEIYQPAEVARLLAAAPAHFLPCLALQVFGGLRTAEIMRMEWQDIDLAGHITISAAKAKTASRRIVPVLPALAAWLTPYKKDSGPLWRGSPEDFYDAQRESAEATAVKADKKKGIAAQPPVTWKANGLRHSFISYRLADIQNTNQVALEAGNSAAVIFRHYRELVKPEAARAYFGILPDAPVNVVQIGMAS